MNRKVFITILNSFVILATLLVQVFTEIGVAPAQAAPAAFWSSGTWTPPPGVTTVLVETWGGGGKGGMGQGGGGGGAGGGGGGGAYSSAILTVNSSTTYTVTVGAGATLYTAPGGDSSFKYSTTTYVLAKGGNSVACANCGGVGGGLLTSGIGTTRYSGGTGGSQFGGYSGGGGAAAGSFGNGANAFRSTAGVGTGGGGSGANGVSGGNTGNGGGWPGGGGSGGAFYGYSAGSRNGGNGGQGLVLISILTTTVVVCTPTPIDYNGGSSNCTATVTSTNPAVDTPIGTVNWTLSADNSGSFTPAASCTPSGSGNTASCSVTYTPGTVGDNIHRITASYVSSTVFASSSSYQDIVLNQYTVTFDANNGSGTMTPQVSHVPAALTSNAFTRAGYIFTGWNTAADGTGTAYASGATYSFAANMILYALWAPAGNALNFDGTNDYVSLGTPSALSFNGTTPFTIEAWIKKSNLTVQSVIVSKMYNGTPYNGYELFSDPGGKIGFIIVNTWSSNAIYVVTTSAFNDTNWHHVAVSYDGSRNANGVQIYVDGVLQPQTVGFNSLTISTVTASPAYIGVRDGDTANAASRFTGTIDEIRIWNVARTQPQIQTNMSNAIAPHPNLLAYYKLDQGTAGGTNTGLTTAIDSSGNILNGTLTNFGLTNPTSSNWVYGNVPLTVHTVTFNANGGVGSNTTQTASTATALNANAFTRTGYAFAGWNTQTGGGGASYTNTQSYNFANDLILYAQWAPNRTVTFYSNGGSGTMPQQITGVTTPLTLNAFTRTGYNFVGWNTVAGGGGTSYADGASYPFTANANLYAQWVPSTYTVAFHPNTGTGSMSPQTENYNTATALNSNTFSKTGYAFAGWDTNSAGTAVVYANGANYTFTANANLYAVWTAEDQTLTFNSNGGSAVDPITQAYDTTVNAPADPTREGHTFGGWYTDDGAFLDAYTFPHTMGLSTTIHAQWTADDQTLTFISNGGTLVDPITQAYGTSVSEPLAPVLTGYDFGGWYTDNGAFLDAYTFPHTMGLSTTVYARWTIKTYTVSYSDNGATGGSKPDDQTKTYDMDLTLATNSGGLVRTGYKFTGWNTLADGLGAHYDEGALYTDNAEATLHAEWTINQYTISFVENGGPEVDDITQDYDTPVTAPAPTRIGYTFDGWYTDGGDPYTFSTMPAENITLYAGWTINQYTISFVENDGTPVAPIIRDYDAIVSAPAEPTRTGYNFGGWYTDDVTFLDAYAFSTMPAENITLYARWVINQYTIFFNSNGGTLVAPIMQDYDTPVTAPDDPTREGYAFDGWYTDDVTFLDAYTFSTMPAGNVSLYAKWTANTYTVSFDPQDGTPPPADQPATFDSAYGALPTVTRTGYDFDGWYTAPTGGSLVTDATVVSTADDHTLYAQWTGIDYTVTFDGNGGDAPSPDSKLVTFGDAYGTLATVSYLGYTFNGWFDAPVGGTQVTDATIVSTADDHTLHAQWTVLPDHTVTFDANGGSGSMPDQVTNIPTALTLNTFTLTGYTFIGWNTETDGSGTFHADGASYPFDADANLYAQWTVNTYTVTFEPQNGSAATSASVTYDSAYGTLPTVTRVGHTFAGWFDAPVGGTEIKSDTIVETAADHTLYARWNDVPPAVTVEQGAGQRDPTYNTPIRFTAVFSEPVNKTTFTRTDVTLGGTAAATTATIFEAAPYDGTTFNIYVTGMTRTGTVTASILANKVQDLTGTYNAASLSRDKSVKFNAPIYPAVTLVSPTKNTLVTSYRPLLDWSNAAPPSGVSFLHYEVQVATDSVFANIVHSGVTVGTITTSRYRLPVTLNPNTRYYWRVRWVSSKGYFSKWSSTYYLRTP